MFFFSLKIIRLEYLESSAGSDIITTSYRSKDIKPSASFLFRPRHTVRSAAGFFMRDAFVPIENKCGELTGFDNGCSVLRT